MVKIVSYLSMGKIVKALDKYGNFKVMDKQMQLIDNLLKLLFKSIKRKYKQLTLIAKSNR